MTSDRIKEIQKTTMKKLNAKEDYKFVFNRCWHIAANILTNYQKQK
jgi:hypothetical protein